MRVNVPSNTNFLASRHIKKEKALPTVDRRRSKTPLLKIPSLSSAKAFLCRREAREKEKESARGTMGREKREETPFPSSLVPRALSIFSLLLFLVGFPAGASAEERG